jgi:3-keto-L-gulonate-6-phosphate decarboxylase
MDPIIQAAIDMTSIDKALEVAHHAVEGGVDWLEVGKPLIVYEGMRAVETIAKEFPDTYVLVDLLIMAAAKRYLSTVKEMGGRNATVLGLIPDYSIRESVRAAKELGIAVTVDLFNVRDTVAAAKQAESYGADYVMVHFGVDQHKYEPENSPFEGLKKVVDAVSIPVAFATYGVEEAVKAVKIGAKVIVQGAPFLTSRDPKSKFKEFVEMTKEAAKAQS